METDASDHGNQPPGRTRARELPGEDDITELLRGWRDGDCEAADRLMRLVYDELHLIASRLIPRAARDATLGPTAIVHELYLKLEDRASVDWKDRAHFFALAARMMRQMLVDQSRTRGRLKRGGDRVRVPLEAADRQPPTRSAFLLGLDEALTDLARRSPRQAAVVELRYFGGLSVEETAACLDIAPRTVVREWRRARARLYLALESRQVL